MHVIAPPRESLAAEHVTAETPALARQYVRATLAELGAAAATIDTAELIASELVTNVVRHVGGALLLQADVIEDRVIVRCFDSGKTRAHVITPGELGTVLAEHGRGLFIVAALASSVIEVPVPGGKMIAAFLPVVTA
jgi:anti-sigma regulatory factor (Ser/Thr protein kinase)